MQSTWKTVRFFISSTFRDMHAERDYLVRIVFPRLREWCADHRIHIIDIDLRWGVTREEAENGKATEICLKAIDGCRPFFVCLLGEQYGWVPDSTKGHRSITHLEILEAVLKDDGQARQKAQAFFYFRASGVLPNPEELTQYSQSERDDYRAAYFTAPLTGNGMDGREMLNTLKDEILGRFADDDRVFIYPCHWSQDSLDATTPGLRGRIAGLEVFGERVERDIKRGILEEFGDHLAALGTVLGPLEREEAAQQAFIQSRVQLHLPDTSIQKAISDYFHSEARTPLVLTGTPGSGKSSALAYWVNQETNREPRPSTCQPAHVIFRSIGASSQSARLPSLLTSITHALQRASRLKIQSEPHTTTSLLAPPTERTGNAEESLSIPADPDELVRAWPNILEAASSQIVGRLLIVIDGLNQLGPHFDPGLTSWLPILWDRRNSKEVYCKRWREVVLWWLGAAPTVR